MSHLGVARCLLSGIAWADERVPLAANFGPAEEVGLGGAVLADALLYGLEGPISSATIGGTTQLTCPRCAIGAPPGFDRAISNALWGGPGAKPFLGRVPDITGIDIAPVASIAFYVSDEAFQLLRGHGFTGEVNTDHFLLAFIEAYGIAMGVNQAVKLTTGRLRPYYALDRTSPLPQSDTDLSFFSAHTTSSFCIAAFVGRDLSDWLVRHDTNVWVARVLPTTVLYGAATLIGVSRIIDQAHYFSDVALGALVGGAIGNLIYAVHVHFDAHGRPRRRHAIELVPLPGGVAVAGNF